MQCLGSCDVQCQDSLIQSCASDCGKACNRVCGQAEEAAETQMDEELTATGQRISSTSNENVTLTYDNTKKNTTATNDTDGSEDEDMTPHKDDGSVIPGELMLKMLETNKWKAWPERLGKDNDQSQQDGVA